MVSYVRNPFHAYQKEEESYIWDILYERYSSQFDHNTVRKSNLPYRIPTESDVHEYLDCKREMELKIKDIVKLNCGLVLKIHLVKKKYKRKIYERY